MLSPFVTQLLKAVVVAAAAEAATVALEAVRELAAD